MSEASSNPFRQLPGIEQLLQDDTVAAMSERYGASLVKQTLRALQNEIRDSGQVPDWAKYAAGYPNKLQQRLGASGYQPVFNLTGTVIHTNLGRAVLSRELWRQVEPIVTRPTNLEFDLSRGRRGSREGFVTRRLCELCDAEAALVVNNNAAALVLMLNTLALGRNVPVSRGELIEIGGSFRLPDIMTRSGCRLEEVGTTNRTRIGDFARATDPAMLLKIHPSNYHIDGFTENASNSEMAVLADSLGVPFCIDLGSGTLVNLEQFGLPHEPTPGEMIRAGADLVTFSGDKLLGGAQAGLIVGRKDLIDQLNSNPLKRALRADKMTLSVLDATLALYEDPSSLPETLPLLRTLTLSEPLLNKRANAVREVLLQRLPNHTVDVQASEGQIGSGALPDQSLTSIAVTLRGDDLDALRTALRGLPTPVIARLQQDALWLDMRGADPLDELLDNLALLP